MDKTQTNFVFARLLIAIFTLKSTNTGGVFWGLEKQHKTKPQPSMNAWVSFC